MTMQCRLIAALICVAAASGNKVDAQVAATGREQSAGQSASDLLPLSDSYGICIVRPDTDTVVRVYAPVDTELAQVVHRGRSVAQFEISQYPGTGFPEADHLSPAMRQVWAQNGFVLLGSAGNEQRILTRNPGSQVYPDLYIRLTISTAATSKLSSAMLIASLKRCRLRAKDLPLAAPPLDGF